jgi:hypothetical protein
VIRRPARILLGAAVGLCVLAACEPAGAPRPAAKRSPTSSPTRQARAVTGPRGPRVEVVAIGAGRRLVRRAVADLKRLGYWRRLTDHLVEVALGTRAGSVNIPDDGHLADAFLTVDGEARGGRCDIRFYPAAIRRDLRRQAEFHADGYLDEPPATLREFWVSILAHELAHCLPHSNFFRQRGEPTARRWEQRVLDAARAET